MTIATGDSVLVAYTGRLDDGTVFDTSRESVAEETGLAEAQPDREYGPMKVEVGSRQVIEGLEDALIGLGQGDTPTVAVPPEKAYGEWTEENVREFETGDLRDMVGEDAMEEGVYLETQNGQRGEIIDLGGDTVRVDFNSPLAGETLEFDIEIIEIDGT